MKAKREKHIALTIRHKMAPPTKVELHLKKAQSKVACRVKFNPQQFEGERIDY